MKIENSPLELELTDNFELLVHGEAHAVNVRTLRQMLDVVYNREEARKFELENPMYYMFRDVKRKEDAALFENSHLRYDITVLPPTKIGTEYNKTYGHYHGMANSKLSFPELYEILNGEAWYVLQYRQSIVSNEATRVFLVKARAGDKIIIPPNFGHVTLNSSITDPLVMDNINEWKFKSDYTPYRQKRGAAYFVMEHDKIKNTNYAAVPKLEEISARDFNRLVNPIIAVKLEEDRTYGLFLKNPHLFDFLKDPMQVEFRS